MVTEASGKRGGAQKIPMVVLEGQKCLLSGEVSAGDTLQIDINRFTRWAKLGDRFRKIFCPTRDKLPGENDFGSVMKKQHRNS